jgi:hypothetical protein
MNDIATPSVHFPEFTGEQIASCPKCGFDDAKYLSVVYESGLSAVNTQTEGAIHNRRATRTSATTTGTVQSATSAKASPPKRRALKFALLLTVVGVVLLARHTPSGLLPLAAGIVWLYMAWTYNRRVYPYEYQVWEQSVMCQRCGTIYVRDASKITLEAVTTGQVLSEQQRKLVSAAQPVLNRVQKAQRDAQKDEALNDATHQEEDNSANETQPDPKNTDPEN